MMSMRGLSKAYRVEGGHTVSEKYIISICPGELRDIKMMSFLEVQKSHEENGDDY